MEKSPTILTICWVIQAPRPVLFRSLRLCGPTSVCIIIAKIGKFLWLVGVSQPWFCCVGVGCCFSKSYLLCSSSRSSVLPMASLLLLCLPSCPSLPTLNFGKHICHICVCFGTGSPFHLMLYVISFFFFVLFLFSFLSLSEKVVAAF